MKYLIIYFIFLITFISLSKEIILKIEGSGRGKEYEEMQLENNSKVVLYKTEGNFKTDLDLYGSADCLGVFKKLKTRQIQTQLVSLITSTIIRCRQY